MANEPDNPTIANQAQDIIGDNIGDAAKSAVKKYVVTTVIPFLIPPLLICVGITVIIFVVWTAVKDAPLDNLNLAFQCRSIDQELNQDCIRTLLETSSEKISSSTSGACGSQDNACVTN